MSEITILLVVYNNSLTINRSVESLLRQTIKNFSLLIIDDGSTDGTSEILSRMKDKRIKVITHKRNLGLTKRLVEGVNEITSPFLARADGDEISHPERLELQLAFLKKNPGFLAVGSNFERTLENGNRLFTSDFPKSYQEIKKTMFVGNPFRHGSLMFRKEAFATAGNYDPHFLFAQDYDLMLRLTSRAPVANLGQSLVTDIVLPDAISQKHRFRQALYALEAQAQSLLRYDYSWKNWFFVPKTFGYVIKSAFYKA